MKYLIVSGSTRDGGQALRIAQWLQAQLSTYDEAAVLDLNQAYVPWDTSALWDKDSEATRQFAPVLKRLEWCDGLIVVTPEWHGMTPGKLVSFFQAACEGKPIAHKPGLIVAESSSYGGSYPEVMLRGFASKNARIIWLPEHLLVRFNEDKFKPIPETSDDQYIQRRAQYCLALLKRYTEVLAPIRKTLLEGLSDFPNGM